MFYVPVKPISKDKNLYCTFLQAINYCLNKHSLPFILLVPESIDHRSIFLRKKNTRTTKEIQISC